jgi:hypothetical protein
MKDSHSNNRCHSSGGVSVTESDSRSDESPDKKLLTITTPHVAYAASVNQVNGAEEGTTK